MGIFFLKIQVQFLTQKLECNVYYSSLFPKLFFPSMNPTTNGLQIRTSILTSHVPISMPYTSHEPSLKLQTSHFPCKNNVWMFTTRLTTMYKNMYNPKSKISLLLLSFIATMLAKVQGENKRNKK